jgi:hypothetical protein
MWSLLSRSLQEALQKTISEEKEDTVEVISSGWSSLTPTK